MSDKELDTIATIDLTITYGDGSSSAYSIDPAGYSYLGGGRTVSGSAVREKLGLIRRISDYLADHNDRYGIPAEG